VSAATRPTEPCDATGAPVTDVARELRLPSRVIAGLDERAAVGREAYGVSLCRPWPPGTREAWQEILDAIAYLLASGDEDDAVFACRLAGHADVWARKRGLYIGLHDG
jgi:hypothetical protein